MKSLCYVVLAFLPSLGCASTLGFTENGFVAKDKGYSIGYANWSLQSVVGGGEWKLENYTLDSGKRPSDEKVDGIYQATTDWVDELGVSRKVKYVIYDLKYRHGNGSSIAVCTIAVPLDMQVLRLSAVAEAWAKSYSGLQIAFKSGEEKRTLSGEGNRTASKIIESKAREVGGKPAREVTFDVVDVDQLEADAEAPRRRIRAVLVQAPLFKEFVDSGGRTARAFLLVMYSSDERKFDKLVDEYESLLGRIQIPASKGGGDSP